MKPESADVHVLAIHPDMGEPPESKDDMDDDEGGDEEAHLDDAWEASKDDDKEGFIKSMSAAIEACVEKAMKGEY